MASRTISPAIAAAVAATADTATGPSTALTKTHLSFLSLSAFPSSLKPRPSRLLSPLRSPRGRRWQVLVAVSAGMEESLGEEGEGEGDDRGSRLYVGNLPYSMTASQLSEVFQEAGAVDNVEIIYDRVTDRSRGFAFVTMASLDEAKNAIQMFNGSQVGGRTVRVNFPEVPRGGEREVMVPIIRGSNRGFVDSPNKIYAGNLGWSLTSEALREAFADQSGLLGAKVIYDRTTGRSRGFGFVSFASLEDAESALDSMNGVEVAGRPLRLNLAEQRTASATDTTPTSATDTTPTSQVEEEASVGG